MAITFKKTSAKFEDDQTGADIVALTIEVYEDTLSEGDEGYNCGFVSYSFASGDYSVGGFKELSQVASIKAEVESIALDRAKSSLTLPTLVGSTTIKDGLGAVTSYIEEY